MSRSWKLTIAGLVLVGCAVCLMWFVGIEFEFEFPYSLTLIRVRNAISVAGVPVAKIILTDGADWSGGVHWHTCSYCAELCDYHRASNLIHVQLQAPDKTTIYHFAYCRSTRVIVPMTERTARHFPSLMPAGDELQGVCQLNGQSGTVGLGSEELKLPAKWFATHHVTR